MIRRVLVAALAVALVSVTIPTTAFADETTSAPTPEVARVAKALQTPSVLNLQNAGQGVVLQKESAKQSNGPFLSTARGKGALAAGIIVAAVLIGYKVSQGPDPTPATQK